MNNTITYSTRVQTAANVQKGALRSYGSAIGIPLGLVILMIQTPVGHKINGTEKPSFLLGPLSLSLVT